MDTSARYPDPKHNKQRNTSARYPDPKHNKQRNIVNYAVMKVAAVVDRSDYELRFNAEILNQITDPKSLCGATDVAVLISQNGKRTVVYYNDEFYEVLKVKTAWKPIEQGKIDKMRGENRLKKIIVAKITLAQDHKDRIMSKNLCSLVG